MQRRSRNLLFAAAVLVFVIGAPLIIFWARGFYIDPERGEVVSTGMVLIDTNVQRLAVTVDGGTEQTESDPVAVRGLLPGRHTVRLEREGYETWEAELEVVAEAVTRVDSVIMVRSEPPSTELAAGPVGAFAASPNGAYAAYVVQSGSDEGIWLHAVGDGDVDRRLLAADGLADDVAVSGVDLLRWSQDGRALLVHAGARWWLLEPHVRVPQATPLAHLDHRPPSEVESDPSEPSTVYYRDDVGSLWRWKTATEDGIPQLLARNVLDYVVAPPKVFVLQDATAGLTVSTYDLRTTDGRLTSVGSLPQRGSGTLAVAEGGGQVSVRTAAGELAVLQRSGGQLEFTPIADGVDDAAWSPDGALLAYRRGVEVWAYDVQPVGDDEETFLVTSLSFSSPLRWYTDSRHLVVLRADALTDASELSLVHVSRTAPLLQRLLTLPGTQPIFAFARVGADLLYVDTSDAGRPLTSTTITRGPGE